MALEGTLNTPLGKVPKKGAVIVGVGGAAVLGIVWYRSKQQAASSTDANATGNSDIDPATGFPYGSPEDQAAQSQIQASSGGYGPLYNYGLGGGGGYNPTPQGPGSYTSNAQWAQAAEDYLVNTIGEHASDVGNALGKYITGQAVTSDQKAFIEQAIAFAGAVPVPAGDGFPPSIRDVPQPPPTQGHAQNPVSGLHVTARFTQADVSWKPSKGATSYRVRIRTPSNHIVQEMNTVDTKITLHGLGKNATYEANVLAEPAAAGAHVARASFRQR
jgi:hypothetical protein